jgi:outer membrane protein insertion porin family
MSIFRRLLPAFLVVLLFATWSSSQTDVSSTAKLFEDAAIAREEAARIWEGLGERIRAAEAWGEAAGAWEKAARSWESAGDSAKSGAAWERFRAAITNRDQAEIRITPVAGTPQRVRVARVSEPLVVRVTDKTGRPVAGIRVLFEIAVRPSPSDGSRLEAVTDRTDSSGNASARLRLGTLTGAYSITASVPDLSREPAIFEVTALPGPAARLEIQSGNNQVLRVNQRALTPLVARVTDLYGNPVEGVPVSYRIVSAPSDAVGHSLSVEEATTDASGLCGVRFQAGHLGGSYIVLVESGDLEGSPSKFEMIVRQTIPTMRLSAVRIEGTADTVALMAGSKLRVGETYLLPDLGRVFREELRRLYATGRFEDVTAAVDETGIEGEGLAIIQVVERAKVASVTLVGMRRVKEADLRAVLGIGEGSPYSVATAERSRRALLDQLENEGYLNATVTLETSVVAAAPKEGEATTAHPPVAITYRIVEQDKVKIGRMNLIGNRYYSDWSLNWHMKTGSGRVYKEIEFNEDRQKIIQRYVERGFLSAVIEDPVITYDRNGRMVLDIVIKEGPQYKMGDISFVGNTAIPSETLRGMLKPTPGQVFRARKFFESIEKMRLATTRHGFAEARIIPQEHLDQRTGIVDFVLRFEEGQILYLEGIEVEGNNKTQERIITREIRLLPGDVLDGEEIEKARKRLEALQFFEPGSVRMDLRQGSKPDQRVLSIKLAEGKTGQLQFGAGYSSVDKLVGFASITKRNFDPFDFWTFTGAGQEISFSAEYGGSKNSFSLSWTEPYWLNRPISIGFDAFNTYQEREGFDWRRRGGALRLSHKYGEYGRFSYKYNVEMVELLRVTALSPTDVQAEVGFPGATRRVRTTASLSTAFNHDTRDDVNFPTSGHIFEISNQLAGRFFGGNVSFNRPVINWSQFRRGLAQTHVIAGRFQYGTITNFFERDNPIPTSEKFYLGGANSIRGYRERSVQLYHPNGTLVGPGRSFILGNLEYRIPFTDDKTMSMAFFYDVGAVYDGEYEIGFDNLVQGVGAGVRFNTPLGPIRLDYGYGLDFPNKNRGQLHFSIGQAF